MIDDGSPVPRAQQTWLISPALSVLDAEEGFQV